MTCARRRVTCEIVTTNDSFFGENLCANPQSSCPRAPDEGYGKCISICDQGGHAEIAALERAGSLAQGATAIVRGHWYVCQACFVALRDAGVVRVILDVAA